MMVIKYLSLYIHQVLYKYLYIDYIIYGFKNHYIHSIYIKYFLSTCSMNNKSIMVLKLICVSTTISKL